MTSTAEIGVTTKTFTVYIGATPEAIWDAITTSEWTQQYGYRTGVDFDLRPGGVALALANEGMKQVGSPDVVIDGEVIEATPPRKLVQTWRMLFEEDLAAEAFSRLTWELEPPDPNDSMAVPGTTKVTVTHDLEGAPTTANLVSGSVPRAGGGWPFILSDLKTLLETGKPLGGIR
jgi:uncharacterized protein YndB with AHSA1/START domain